VAAILMDLKDYAVMDNGEVAFKHHCLIDLLARETPIDGLKALRHPDIELHNRRNPAHQISIIDIDGEITGLPATTFDWKISHEYKNINIVEFLEQRLLEKFPKPKKIYRTRMQLELSMMIERQMEDFLKTLIYIVDVFDANGVVRGIGRGSCCASLVLFLIGVHMVDPIEYDIPIDEFLR
jgi:hypothetical protein